MSSTEIEQDISLAAYDKICRDIRDQPKWRVDSDTDAKYYDGAQLSQETIDRLKQAGIPPQDSNLIKPTINAVLGLEARSRTDYKITSDDESQAEIAEGLSAKIKEAETESRADRAMSDAYSSMMRTGIGWVEVSREFDPLKYRYRVRCIHRNEIYWDWSAKEPDLSDARYLRRDNWLSRSQALKVFPDQTDLIEGSWSNWTQTDVYDGTDSEMARAYENEQAWGKQNDEFLNRESGLVKMSELWYRYYVDGIVMVLRDGSAVEYNPNNPMHDKAIAAGAVQPQKCILPAVRVSMWLGPHKLMDIPTPLPHRSFPYVPFWCFRKDLSRTPYGLIRDMRGPQDKLIDYDTMLFENMNSKRVEVDNDALDLVQNSYQEVAQNVSNPRSFVVLNANRRNPNGFKVTSDNAMTMQLFQLAEECQRRIESVSGIYRAMLGQSTQASSGVAINNLVEQGSTVLAEPNDNFRYARRIVGEQLLALVKADLAKVPSQVSVKEGTKQKVIYFNRQTDEGIVNDISSSQVKVVLEDVPATPTFRAQQYQSFSEIIQAAPPIYQAVLYPAMLELSDIPNRHAIAEQLRKVGGVPGQTTPEQEQQQAMQMQQQQAMQMKAVELELQTKEATVGKLQAEVAKLHADAEAKARELDIKEEQLHVDSTIKAEEITIAQEKQALDEKTAEANMKAQTVKAVNQVTA